VAHKLESEILVRTKLLVTTLIITLLVAYYLLGTGYLKQRQERTALASRVADAYQILARIPIPSQDIEPRLAEAKVRLAEVAHSFPTTINSTEVINHILELAKRYSITAIPLATEEWSTESVGEHQYNVFRLSVEARGSYPDLVTFISQLEKGLYRTLVIENAAIAWADEQPEDEAISVTASLDLAIYTQYIASD